MKGTLIVLEGLDGSGKATQAQALCERLEAMGLPVRKLSFPVYESESSALVRMYLQGEFGTDPSAVNAYAASSFYAVDRYASYKKDWTDFYAQGGILVADRYTTSNAIHQCSKLEREEWEEFLQWLFHYEYQLLGLPEPTKVFYLDVPTDLTEKLMQGRQQATGTQADIHEKDDAYLRRCRENAQKVVDFCGWEKISCARDENSLREIEDIHREIFDRVRELLG